MVLAVRDAPRVVGNKDEGVEDEAHGIVEGLRGAERLVSTCCR